MTKQDKLKKVIEYAIDRGLPVGMVESFGSDNWLKIIVGNETYYRFIFDHDFAKAVFGEGKEIIESNYSSVFGEDGNLDTAEILSTEVEWWEYHHQQAVISEDPIDYYYQYVKSR